MQLKYSCHVLLRTGISKGDFPLSPWSVFSGPNLPWSFRTVGCFRFHACLYAFSSLLSSIGVLFPIFIQCLEQFRLGVRAITVLVCNQNSYFIVLFKSTLGKVGTADDTFPVVAIHLKVVHFWMKYPIGGFDEVDILVRDKCFDEIWMGLIKMRTDNHSFDLCFVFFYKIEELESSRGPSNGDLARGAFCK